MGLTPTPYIWRGGSQLKKLAIAQIVSGLLITVFSFISTKWGFPTSAEVPMPEAPGVTVSINISPGPTQMLAMNSAHIALVLGMVVLGVGVAQFVKAIRQS
jgi:hypothetical protein